MPVRDICPDCYGLGETKVEGVKSFCHCAVGRKHAHEAGALLKLDFSEAEAPKTATEVREQRTKHRKPKVTNPEAAPAPQFHADPIEAGVGLRFSSAARHDWLEDAAQFAATVVRDAGGDVPAKVRVTIGWPLGSRGGQHAIGQCWHAEASTDAHREIFVSPELSDSSRIIGVLIHELVHAALPPDAKHGAEFKRLATAAGLVGKMTATLEGEELQARIAEWVDARGEYPAGALDRKSSTRKKQSTRLLKVACPVCGYTARITKKWLEQAGAPICPIDNEPFQED